MSDTNSLNESIRLDRQTLHPGDKLSGSILASPAFDVPNVSLSMSIAGKVTTKIQDVKTEEHKNDFLKFIIPIQRKQKLPTDFEYKFSVFLPDKLLPSINIERQFLNAKVAYNITLDCIIEDFSTHQISKEFFVAPLLPNPLPTPSYAIHEAQAVRSCFCLVDVASEAKITAKLSHGFAYPGDIVKIHYSVFGHEKLKVILSESVMARTNTSHKNTEKYFALKNLYDYNQGFANEELNEAEVEIPRYVCNSMLRDHWIDCQYAIKILRFTGETLVTLPIQIVQKVDRVTSLQSA